jgi:glutamine synthetase
VATDLERFVEADGRAERVKDVRKKIDAEGVTYVYYQFISVTGRIMGKASAPHWETMAHKGFQLVYGSTANLFTDRLAVHRLRAEAWELVGVPEPRRSRNFRGTTASRDLARARNREDGTGPERSHLGLRGNCRRIREEFEERTGMHLRAAWSRDVWLRLSPDGTPSVRHGEAFATIDQFSELQPIIHKMVEYRRSSAST